MTKPKQIAGIGAQSSSESVAKWLETLFVDEIKDLAGKRVALDKVIMVHHGSGREVYAHEFPQGSAPDDAGLMSAAETILGRAESDAEHINGRQSYVLLAFFHGCGNKEKRSKTIQVNGRIVGDWGDASDPPTPEGKYAQRMRHEEGAYQLLITTAAAQIGPAVSFAEKMMALSMQAMTQQGEMFFKLQQVLMQQSLDRSKEEAEKAKYERMTAVIDKVLAMAPLLVGTITGRQVVPESAENTAIVEMLADVLDEEAVSQMLPLLQAKLGARGVPLAAIGPLFAHLQSVRERLVAGRQRVGDALATTGFVNGAAAETSAPEPEKH